MAQNKNVISVTESTINAIEIKMNSFIADASKLTNKAAASRARMLSLEIAVLLKDYRFNSIKASFKKQ